MTGRTVKEWVGKSPDEAVPPRVRVRVFTRKDGRCGECTRKIAAGEGWICEHLVALINGGQNRESNLGVTCLWCKPEKDAADVAVKSKTYDMRRKHIGVKPDRPGPLSKEYRRAVLERVAAQQAKREERA